MSSYHLNDFSAFLQRKRATNFTPPKRYDEVLYTSYVRHSEDIEVALKGSNIGEKWEEAVASDMPIGEVFCFDYGVVVFWGLDEEDEKSILNELIPFEVGKYTPEQVEVESFKFCHSSAGSARLYNDIINLKTGNHMVKLTISHALAQSVKLSYYEEIIEDTIDQTKNLPLDVALTGRIPLSRTNITKMIGKLFVMRIDVNLISNVLDTPELFWYRPSFLKLYQTVRGYLEISQRVEVLNQRVTVISDLLDMLRENLNIGHGETLEWIVIILIGMEILIGIVTICLEVYHHRVTKS